MAVFKAWPALKSGGRGVGEEKEGRTSFGAHGNPTYHISTSGNFLLSDVRRLRRTLRRRGRMPSRPPSSLAAGPQSLQGMVTLDIKNALQERLRMMIELPLVVGSGLLNSSKEREERGRSCGEPLLRATPGLCLHETMEDVRSKDDHAGDGRGRQMRRRMRRRMKTRPGLETRISCMEELITLILAPQRLSREQTMICEALKRRGRCHFRTFGGSHGRQGGE